MTFREERTQIIPHDSLLGQSMQSIKHKEHEKLASEMAEWEKNNTVEIISNDYRKNTNVNFCLSTKNLPVTPIEYVPQNRDIVRTDSGRQNIHVTKSGNYRVIIGG